MHIYFFFKLMEITDTGEVRRWESLKQTGKSRATLGMLVPYNGGNASCIFTCMWKSLLYNLGKMLCYLFKGEDGWESELLLNHLGNVVMLSKSRTVVQLFLILTSAPTQSQL